MRLAIFFVVMVVITVVVERMLARLGRNDGAVHGGGSDGVPPGVD